MTFSLSEWIGKAKSELVFTTVQTQKMTKVQPLALYWFWESFKDQMGTRASKPIQSFFDRGKITTFKEVVLGKAKNTPQLNRFLLSGCQD